MDKMLACLNHGVGVAGAGYMQAPNYFDIWRSASAMMKRYGSEAGLEAAKRADELLAEGDTEGSATWRQILRRLRSYRLAGRLMRR